MNATVAEDDLLGTGDLDAARARLVEAVKKNPGDQRARMFLFQLQCINGEWDKAQAQLRSLASLSPEAQMLSVSYNQAIDAERVRQKAWAGQAPFHSLAPTSPWVEDLVASLTAAAAGRASEAEELRDKAFDAAGDTPGLREGHAGESKIGWVADVDSRLGPAFEAVVNGRWGIIPFEAVEVIKVEGPSDLRDVVWLPITLRLRSGQSAAAFLPARYPGSEADADPAVRLGRTTLWRDEGAGELPLGQKLWSFDDGEEAGVLTLKRLDFA